MATDELVLGSHCRADPRIIDAQGIDWPRDIPYTCSLARPGDTIWLRGEWQVELARDCLRLLGTQNVKLEVVEAE